MLVLSRKADERIVITAPDGRVITVRVNKVGSVNVRLGIEAPLDYIILREELMDDASVDSIFKNAERSGA